MDLVGDNRLDLAYLAALRDYDKLPNCPFCDRLTALRRYPQEQQRLGIVCLEAVCEWNVRTKTTFERPLPFLLVDYDIYRSAPAILLGTIDKLALIGRHRSTINRIRGMFGLARLLDDNGLIEPPYYLNVSKAMEGRRTIAPSFSGGVEVFVDPVPSLIIQDEARLLEESLGTFAGLFETTLYQWFRSLRPILGDQMSGVPDGREDIRLPKVVCATATISNPERQIRVLYQKRVRQFPRKGTRLYRSFYANPSSFEGSGGECNDVLALFSKVSYVRSLVTLAGAVGNCRKLPNMLNERDRFQMSSLVVRLGLFLHARRSSSHQTTLTRTNSQRAFGEQFEC